MFLDDKLELKIADFGCCSIDQSGSMAATDARFYPQRPFWNSPVSADDDLYALGSCMYEVLTGVAPFGDVCRRKSAIWRDCDLNYAMSLTTMKSYTASRKSCVA
jgi:serine/threonine protein kinase